MMKKFNKTLLISIFFVNISACNANSDVPYEWHSDGTITLQKNKLKTLDIQNAYDAKEFEGHLYIAGFKIKSDGENIPTVVDVDLTKKNKEIYWTFDSIINDLFVYQHKIHANNSSGAVFNLESGKWQQSSLILKEDSEIVYSDDENELIVCYKSSPVKVAPHVGGCYSTTHKWQHDFSWFSISPRLCENKLLVYEDGLQNGSLIQIDISSGKILGRKQIKIPPKNLCQAW